MDPLLLTALANLADKVFSRFFPNQEEADKAKLELLKEAQTQEFQLALSQAQINVEEAKSASIFVAGWRPAIGWVCAAGLFWNFLGYPMANWAAALLKSGFAPPALLSDNLMELAVSMLGMATLRSWEKWKGVAKG